MKNKILLMCGFLLLIVFIIAGTYTWYLYFMNVSGDLDINNNSNITKDGNIVLLNSGEIVYEGDAEAIEDTNINEVAPYNFQVINKSSEKNNYTLYLEDVLASEVNDGCTDDTLLTRDMLKFQLSLNGNVIREGYLSDIIDNILDERDLNANSTNNYALRTYIHSDNENDWYGRHYHYRVAINKGD